MFKLHVLCVSLHILNHCVNFNKTWYKAFLDNWNSSVVVFFIVYPPPPEIQGANINHSKDARVKNHTVMELLIMYTCTNSKCVKATMGAQTTFFYVFQ